MKMNHVMTLAAVLFIYFFLICGLAQAGGGITGNSIEEIITYNNGVVRVEFTKAYSDPDGCGSTRYAFISAADDKKMYATLLSAYLADKQIGLYVSGCLTQSGVTAAKIIRIHL